MHFALVIPALNEEEAIAGTLRRALAARVSIIEHTPVKHVTIVFVNDGCTDRTQSIVDQDEFKEVVKINYGRNRGYGAAIKAGFQATDADLVGFIDADGTCDPEFCVKLINAMLDQKADVVLAARLNPDTKMPLIRKIGNRLFATLLGVVSGHTEITDTASGFRIIRRSSLKLMSPLPDGLHFTPAMSCICLLDPRLKIIEANGMLYKDREGRSKLSVIKDGFRFLYTILFSACCYAPLKTMAMASGLVAVSTLLAAVLVGFMHPQWLPVGFTALLGTLWVMLLIGVGVAAHQLNYLLIGPRTHVGSFERLLQKCLDYKRLIIGGMVVGALSLVGMALVAVTPVLFGLRESVALIAFLLLGIIGMLMALGGVIVRVIWAVSAKQQAMFDDEYSVKPVATLNTTGGRYVPPVQTVTTANTGTPLVGSSR